MNSEVSLSRGAGWPTGPPGVYVPGPCQMRCVRGIRYALDAYLFKNEGLKSVFDVGDRLDDARRVRVWTTAARPMAGWAATLVLPHATMVRVVVMTAEPVQFAKPVQPAAAAGAWVEKMGPWDGCLAVVVPAPSAPTKAATISAAFEWTPARDVSSARATTAGLASDAEWWLQSRHYDLRLG
jgi:hypothetical protein